MDRIETTGGLTYKISSRKARCRDTHSKLHNGGRKKEIQDKHIIRNLLRLKTPSYQKRRINRKNEDSIKKMEKIWRQEHGVVNIIVPRHKEVLEKRETTELNVQYQI